MWTSLNGNQTGGGGGGGSGTTDLFSNREISLLIELVEALPVLYAADKKSFKSIITREKAWKIIGDKLNRTVSECEKKWRYLRDKYVKERRRLQDEAKLSPGVDIKSSWQHYEAMEFLSKHLRLPCNSQGDKNSSASRADDEDSMKMSEGSPSHSFQQSPPNNENNIPKLPNMAKLTMPNWPLSEQEQISRQLQNSAGYSMFQRPMVPPLAAHPLWAFLNNNLQQASNQLTQAQALVKNEYSSSNMANQNTAREEGEPTPKARKTSHVSTQGNQDINIHVSLSDLLPSEKYSEYHFCVALAQMMELIPAHDRAEVKIKLMQLIRDSVAAKPTGCFNSAVSTSSESDQSHNKLETTSITNRQPAEIKTEHQHNLTTAELIQ